MGLLSPVDTHQVIHVKGSAAPHPIPHFPSKAKAPGPDPVLCAPDSRRSRAGVPKRPHSLPQGWARDAGGDWAPRGTRERIPPPRAGTAPSLDAAPCLSSPRRQREPKIPARKTPLPSRKAPKVDRLSDFGLQVHKAREAYGGRLPSIGSLGRSAEQEMPASVAASSGYQRRTAHPRQLRAL